MTGDEVSQLGSSTLSTPKTEDSIWSDKYVTKVACKNGKQGWQCGWCNKVFSTLHATRVVCHILKIKGGNIATCRAIIPEEHQERYRKIRDTSMSNNSIRAKVKDAIEELIEGRQELATTLFMSGHGTSSKKSPKTTTITSFLTSPLPRGEKRKKSSGSIQTTIDTALENSMQSDIRHSNNSRLTMAIADCIHSDGLPFRFGESPRFHKILRLARTVGNDYTPPNRNHVAGRLLNLNYECCCNENKAALLAEAATFGLQFVGDGATIKRMPFINVLGICGYAPPKVLSIHDCSEHLAGGGKKDAPFIAQLFESEVEQLDPSKTLTNVFFFDGASNVQKAGEILEAINPGAYCLHGSEHVISLFFSDISKLKPIKVRSA